MTVLFLWLLIYLLAKVKLFYELRNNLKEKLKKKFQHFIIP